MRVAVCIHLQFMALCGYASVNLPEDGMHRFKGLHESVNYCRFVLLYFVLTFSLILWISDVARLSSQHVGDWGRRHRLKKRCTRSCFTVCLSKPVCCQESCTFWRIIVQIVIHQKTIFLSFIIDLGLCLFILRVYKFGLVSINLCICWVVFCQADFLTFF